MKQKQMLKRLEVFIRYVVIVGGLLTLFYGLAYSKANKVNGTTGHNSAQIYTGLIDYYPTDYWMLNDMGWSQEYIDLKAPTKERRLRTREMLIAYGWGGTYDQRDTIGMLYGIKTEFLVCVCKSETQLGKYTKTNGNLGNIGNTDSGATITYDHWLQGVAGIGKTLNNRYLGQYNELWQLSNYGQKGNGYIYASSYENWHINTKNCLSNINGYDVGNAYEFRR